MSDGEIFTYNDWCYGKDRPGLLERDLEDHLGMNVLNFESCWTEVQTILGGLVM